MKTGRRHIAALRIGGGDGFRFFRWRWYFVKAESEVVVDDLVGLAGRKRPTLWEINVVGLWLELERDKVTDVVRYLSMVREGA